jgi:hypothetical protein
MAMSFSRRAALVFGLTAFMTAGAWILYHILVIGGVYAPEYTAVGMVRSDHEDCTGTLIGPMTVLTAAHCVPSSPSTLVSFESDGGNRDASCWRHKNYVDVPKFDVAVCQLQKPLQTLTPERLAPKTTTIQPPDVVSFVGYGCYVRTKLYTSGVRRKGEGKVVDTKQEVLTIEGDGVCDGDSGGPVFRGPASDRGPVVAVISDDGMLYKPQSLFVSVLDPAIRDWLDEMKSTVTICEEGVALAGCP